MAASTWLIDHQERSLRIPMASQSYISSSNYNYNCNDHSRLRIAQVSVFKEDFDQERRDRELTRANMEKLRKKLDETTDQLTTTRSQV